MLLASVFDKVEQICQRYVGEGTAEAHAEVEKGVKRPTRLPMVRNNYALDVLLIDFRYLDLTCF